MSLTSSEEFVSHRTLLQPTGHTSSRLKVTRRIIALGDENTVVHTTFQRFIQWYWCTHEFLFYLA